MAINFERQNVEVELDEPRVALWIEEVVGQYEAVLGEISVFFCDDEYLLDMNREHLQHDFYTDIITFDYVAGELISGDLFISIDRVRENADELKQSFERELHRVIIHGVLHLLGYDDHSDEDEAEMRLQENDALALLFHEA